MRVRKLDLVALSFLLVQLTAGQSTTLIDFQTTPKPTSSVPLFSIGSDRTAIFLRDSHQRDLKAFQSAIPFKYLRCHGIFNEEMDVVKRDASGNLVFNWTKVDQFIDRLRAVKLRPFVEFAYMPEALASGKETVFYYRGNSTPPKKQGEWAQLIHAFTRHQIERFGINEVRQWYFEVWNEPNLDYFWRGSMNGYFAMYETSARALKSIDSQLRVGGPSSAGFGWIKEFLAFCKSNSVPVDFVSTHAYGATQGFLDAEGKGQTILDTSPGAVHEGIKWARSLVKESAYPNLPFFITEWGPSYSQVDPVHDNYICAAYILEKVTKSQAHTEGLSYWTFSDQFEEGGPPSGPFVGGFGLLNFDGLRKPGFFAYQFFAKLQSLTYPTQDDRVIATKKGDRVSVVTWNYTAPKLTEPNNPFFHKDQKPKTLPDKKLRLTGLTPGSYKLQRTGVGYMRNDVYGEYLAMGSPKGNRASLPSEIVRKLSKVTTGQPESLGRVEVGKDGTLEISLPMRTNDAWLVELVKVWY